ncbi:MAG TPA: hypothetical protein VIY73_10600, partial [Polyangiaceae bacterium]
MTTMRWKTLCAVVVLSASPLVGLACGSSQSNGSGGDGGTEDGTTDGAQHHDGAGGDGTGGDATNDGTGTGDQGAGDEGAPDGDAGGGGGCVDACPPSAQCGHVDTCNGNVVACGTACPKGEVCTGTGA